MNRRLLRAGIALLALATAAVVLAVTAVGLVAMVAGLVLTNPMSQGRILSATLATVGAALLLVTYAVDPYALRRAPGRVRSVAYQLAETIASAGRQ